MFDHVGVTPMMGVVLMSRRYGDEVEVRVRDEVPEQFLWKGRLYLVHEVLDRWCETGSWWRGPEIRGLVLGLASRDGATGASASTNVVPGSTALPGIVPGGATAVLGIDLQERSYWRVSAGAGRSASLGVYDLCLEESRGRWTLVRTHD